MQCAVIEFARNVLGWEDAHSTEVDPKTTHPVVSHVCQESVVNRSAKLDSWGINVLR